MNIERPTSNVEWEKMKKQTYDLEERLLEYTEIAVECSVLDVCFSLVLQGPGLMRCKCFLKVAVLSACIHTRSRPLIKWITLYG